LPCGPHNGGAGVLEHPREPAVWIATRNSGRRAAASFFVRKGLDSFAQSSAIRSHWHSSILKSGHAAQFTRLRPCLTGNRRSSATTRWRGSGTRRRWYALTRFVRTWTMTLNALIATSASRAPCFRRRMVPTSSQLSSENQPSAFASTVINRRSVQSTWRWFSFRPAHCLSR
jgi:hypothetical protein